MRAQKIARDRISKTDMIYTVLVIGLLSLVGWMIGVLYLQHQIDSKLEDSVTNSVQFWSLANSNIESILLERNEIRLDADYGAADCDKLFVPSGGSRKCRYIVEFERDFKSKPVIITSLMAIDLSASLRRENGALIENFKISTGYDQSESPRKRFSFLAHVWGTNWVNYMKYSWLALEVPQ